MASTDVPIDIYKTMKSLGYLPYADTANGGEIKAAIRLAIDVLEQLDCKIPTNPLLQQFGVIMELFRIKASKRKFHSVEGVLEGGIDAGLKSQALRLPPIKDIDKLRRMKVRICLGRSLLSIHTSMTRLH